MNFHIITLFPNACTSYLEESILKRAIEDEKIKVKFYNPRDFSPRKKGSSLDPRIDKPPYGGGPGMVIQAEPVIRAIAKAKGNKKKVKIIFLSPGGKQFTNEYAHTIAQSYTDIIFVSGRYEGIDARIKKIFKMEDISIGPFVLTGGELPAMMMLDAIARQKKGILGNFDSIEESRVSSHDVYTRPEIFIHKGKKYRVPKILLSGNPKLIQEWKQSEMSKKINK